MSEPKYITREDDFTGPHGISADPRFALRRDFIEKTKGVPAMRGRWECPNCGLQFMRRKPCVKHIERCDMGPERARHKYKCHQLLDRAKTDAECSEKINAFEAQGIHAQCVWENGAWEIWEMQDIGFFTVSLTIEQYIEAMQAAEKRTARGVELNRKGHNQQDPKKKAEDDKIGSLGERANLLRLGLPFSIMDHYEDDLRAESGGEKPADYGDHEVKTMRKGGNHLILTEHDRNKNANVFILAQAALCDLDVDFLGWAHRDEVFRKEYFNNKLDPKRPPCYNFPKDKLHPMSTLPDPVVALKKDSR